MKRKAVLTILIFMMVFSAGTAYAANVFVDGKRLHLEVEPVNINGRLLVPFRDILTALGAYVDWDSSTGKVSAYKGDISIEMTVGGAAYKNGKPVALDVPARIIKGRTMVPVRFVSETMGAQVKWDIPSQSVIIITGKLHPLEYTWEYGGHKYTFGPVNLTEYEYQTILDYYRSKPHPSLTTSYYQLSTYTYSYDNDGEEILSALVNRLKEYAETKNITGDRVVEFVIAFVQAFPYINDSISTPYDDYTRYPVETLLERKGDCEDTALLTAVLLKKLGYGTALIIMPEEGHAAVGIWGGQGVYGTYYEVGGKKYFYLETTAPGWPIGQVPEDVKGARALVVPL